MKTRYRPKLPLNDIGIKYVPAWQQAGGNPKKKNKKKKHKRKYSSTAGVRKKS